MLTDLTNLNVNLTDLYSVVHKPIGPKFPFSLPSEEQLSLHFRAAHDACISSYGNEIQNDNDAIDTMNRTIHWFYSSKRGLILMGPCGNGKTTMLQTIKCVTYPYSTLGNAVDIYDVAKRTQGEHIRYWDEAVLLIDDLGVEPANGKNYGEDFTPITKLLLHRYEKRLTTIIATNLGFAHICQRYSERVADRLYEMFEVIPFKHESYRR